MFQRFIASFLAVFLMFQAVFIPHTYAAEPMLPQPHELLTISAAYTAPLLRGVRVSAENGMRLEFILDSGDESTVDPAEFQEAVGYFLAALMLPAERLWVNLSPYEADRVTDQTLADTTFGRDLIAEDYLLKQISASLTHPSTDTGKAYWGDIAQTTDRYQKVWIVPATAKISEYGSAAFITDATMNVMTEKDYLAMSKNDVADDGVSTDPVRERIVPLLTHEVNRGTRFARLRQMYHALVLAQWFKRRLASTTLGAVRDSGDVRGIAGDFSAVQEAIVGKYRRSFDKGVYSLIAKERDNGRLVKRQYFSGGASFGDAVKKYEDTPVTSSALSDFAQRMVGKAFKGIVTLSLLGTLATSAAAQDNGKIKSMFTAGNTSGAVAEYNAAVTDDSQRAAFKAYADSLQKIVKLRDEYLSERTKYLVSMPATVLSLTQIIEEKERIATEKQVLPAMDKAVLGTGKPSSEYKAAVKDLQAAVKAPGNVVEVKDALKNKAGEDLKNVAGSLAVKHAKLVKAVEKFWETMPHDAAYALSHEELLRFAEIGDRKITAQAQLNGTHASVLLTAPDVAVLDLGAPVMLGGFLMSGSPDERDLSKYGFEDWVRGGLTMYAPVSKNVVAWGMGGLLLRQGSASYIPTLASGEKAYETSQTGYFYGGSVAGVFGPLQISYAPFAEETFEARSTFDSLQLGKSTLHSQVWSLGYTTPLKGLSLSAAYPIVKAHNDVTLAGGYGSGKGVTTYAVDEKLIRPQVGAKFEYKDTKSKKMYGSFSTRYWLDQTVTATNAGESKDKLTKLTVSGELNALAFFDVAPEKMLTMMYVWEGYRAGGKDAFGDMGRKVTFGLSGRGLIPHLDISVQRWYEFKRSKAEAPLAYAKGEDKVSLTAKNLPHRLPNMTLTWIGQTVAEEKWSRRSVMIAADDVVKGLTLFASYEVQNTKYLTGIDQGEEDFVSFGFRVSLGVPRAAKSVDAGVTKTLVVAKPSAPTQVAPVSNAKTLVAEPPKSQYLRFSDLPQDALRQEEYALRYLFVKSEQTYPGCVVAGHALFTAKATKDTPGAIKDALGVYRVPVVLPSNVAKDLTSFTAGTLVDRGKTVVVVAFTYRGDGKTFFLMYNAAQLDAIKASLKPFSGAEGWYVDAKGMMYMLNSAGKKQIGSSALGVSRDVGGVDWTALAVDVVADPAFAAGAAFATDRRGTKGSLRIISVAVESLPSVAAFFA